MEQRDFDRLEGWNWAVFINRDLLKSAQQWENNKNKNNYTYYNKNNYNYKQQLWFQQRMGEIFKEI